MHKAHDAFAIAAIRKLSEIGQSNGLRSIETYETLSPVRSGRLDRSLLEFVDQSLVCVVDDVCKAVTRKIVVVIQRTARRVNKDCDERRYDTH